MVGYTVLVIRPSRSKPFKVTVGLNLAAHRARKLFGWFGGPELDATRQPSQGSGSHWVGATR
jgi:hypothetical protein